MTLLVTGAAGRLGSRLVRRLAAEGVPFVAVDRVAPEGVPASAVELLDVRDPELDRVMRERGVTAVVHLAFCTSPRIPDEERRSIDLDGSRNVLTSALSAGVPSLVLASSGRVYGDATAPGGRPDAAGTYVNPGPDLYAAHKLEVEDSWFAAAGRHPITVAALRIAIVCDEHGGAGMGDQIRMAARTGRYLLVGRHDARIQLAHVDDVCDAILAAVGRSGVFDVASDGALPVSELFRRAAEHGGRPARPMRLPERPLAALLGVMWRLKVAPIPPLYLRFFRLDIAKPNAGRTRELLGAPRHSIDDVIREIAAHA